MPTNRVEGWQDALLTRPPDRLEIDLNTAADPVSLWGRIAAEYSECWDGFFKGDLNCCEHNWPPLDEDEPQCLGCGLNYAEWSE
ncbi:hypothetical protein [Micromonospora sp. NPDC047730]|uniref:hypothetical protein n=1 Tax=Micromonospora sp. NPDC047730 TaxID=3364253 RepID=UPI0037240FC5